MTRLCTTLVLLLGTLLSFGQNETKSFLVRYVDAFPKIDGILDEPLWNEADAARDFQQYFPSDTTLAKQPTEIRMVYNGVSLYIGITVHSVGNDWVIPSLERDFRAGGNDNITLIFDTFNDGTNAFLFGINPYGVRREALISGGGQDLRGFTTSWDVKWQGESKIYENRYTAELAIPLTSFKFEEGVDRWRFQSYRFDMQSNERSAWARVPQNQLIFNLAFMGEMRFERPLGKSRTPLALIPYTNLLVEKDHTSQIQNTKLKVGGDAKVAIGNGMNLDITLNPDFSNVEVDDIFTNLTRFEISLPERRQFFIDNSDLFASFGGPRDASPFFSRRIGIAEDSSGANIENRILGGVRLSGKLNQDWRLGFLNIQTDEDVDNQIPSNNNMMFALQKKVFARSNVGMFLINRQSVGSYDFLAPEDAYNRVVGIDYNLASEDNRWIGKYYLHKSFQPDDSAGNFSAGTFMARNSRRWNAFADLVYIDEGFRSDLGFVPRTDMFKSATSVQRVFWPKKGFINNHGFELFPIITWRPGLDFRKTDHRLQFEWGALLQDQSEFTIGVSNEYVFLVDPFDPTDSEGGVPLPADRGYTFNSAGIGYESNEARKFSLAAELKGGEFFNGGLFSAQGELTYRMQPKALLTLAFAYDRITLPDPYPSASFWLLSPRVNITFSKSVFWSTIFQYSNQRDNLGINSRLQWRFAPLSDLFLVYNDNYFTTIFAPKYRSINLKLTYWLNI